MLDRESTFAHPEIVKLLQTQFVPIAIDQAYQRRQKDAEGEFYRKLASQGPRNNFQGTTQGFYAGTSAGKLLFYNNNRDPEKVLRLLRKSLEDYRELEESQRVSAAIELDRKDARYNPSPPEGGLVVCVRAKVLDGYEPTENRWRRIFQSSVSRDNLWVSKAEHQALARGDVLESLQRRIAKYHLVDNTRGEPPMWKDREIREISMTIEEGKLRGKARLETADGSRGGILDLAGVVEIEAGQVTRLQWAAKGQFWGDGPFTRGAPKGKFPLAITFELTDPNNNDPADLVPPQGSRGWVQGYIR